MNAKLILTLALACLAFACAIEARSVASAVGGPVSRKKGRVLPGAIAVKKLVLLKFKKIIPISLILLKSGDENEAELVPVYPSAEIPPNVQFIPTPNGISGDKEVQAIAIPSELHEQLESHGLADLEHLQTLLSQAQEEKEESGAADAEELLNVKEDDENQLLVAGSAEKKPAKEDNAAAVVSSVRRLSADNASRSGLRTAVDEIPLFVVSGQSGQQERRQFRRHHPGRRFHA